MRLIDADEFFKNFPELAIEPYINAPTVERPQGECLGNVIELFNKYDVLLVHIEEKVVPVKNTSKQECYNLLYEIQELIEWRKILWKKNNL